MIAETLGNHCSINGTEFVMPPGSTELVPRYIEISPPQTNSINKKTITNYLEPTAGSKRKILTEEPY